MKDKLKPIEVILLIISLVFQIYVIFAEPRSYVPVVIALALILIVVGMQLYENRHNKDKNLKRTIAVLCLDFLLIFSADFRTPHMGYGIEAIRVLAGILALVVAIWILRMRHKSSSKN